MKLILKKIKYVGDKNGKLPYEHVYIGEFETGKKIQIEDYSCQISKDYINRKIECLLYPYLGKNPYERAKSYYEYEIKGEFLGEYSFFEDWSESTRDLNDLHGVKTEEGVFCIDSNYMKDFSIKKGDLVIFFTDRISLFAWRLIE